jgi:hypothetical protein
MFEDKSVICDIQPQGLDTSLILAIVLISILFPLLICLALKNQIRGLFSKYFGMGMQPTSQSFSKSNLGMAVPNTSNYESRP